MTDVAKYSIDLTWKNFNLSLPAVEAWMRSNAGELYCGNSAHTVLQLWFLEEPSEEIKAAIVAYWDALTDQSEEATSYFSQAQARDAELAAREDAVTKSFDQLSTQQKKLLMGVSLVASDYQALITAFAE